MKAEHRQRYDRMVEGLRAKKLKLTPQRLAILRLFCADESHPTAQDLFARLGHTYPTMSFATVYNTLDALVDAGLTSTLHLGRGSRESRASRFDPNVTPHHHAICDACGHITDVPDDPRKVTRAAAAGTTGLVSPAPGFTVRAVERVYRGLCAACVGPRVQPAPSPATLGSKRGSVSWDKASRNEASRNKASRNEASRKPPALARKSSRSVQLG